MGRILMACVWRGKQKKEANDGIQGMRREEGDAEEWGGKR